MDTLHEQLYANPEQDPGEFTIRQKPLTSSVKPEEESVLSQRTLQLLERERRKYRCLSELSGEILFDYDRQTDTIEYTDRYCEIFGGNNVVLHAADAIRKSEHVHDEDRQRLYRELEKLTPENPTLRTEVKLKTQYGTEEWFEIFLKALFDEKEEYCDYIGKIANINRLKSESLHWKKQAYQDYLTGLYNRPAMEEWMKHQIMMEPDQAFGLMMIDIDNFKKVNDSGLENGDNLLKDTAKLLRHHLRCTDIIARVGGDEFAVMMKGVESPEILENKAEQIIDDFARELSPKYQTELSASIGIARYPQDGQDQRELLGKADQVLLETKKSQKGKCLLYRDR